MAKENNWCVWRTHQKMSDCQEKPAASFYDTRQEAEERAERWRERDCREIASYTTPDDHHIPVIRDRRYCVRNCDPRDEFCACWNYIQEHYSGNLECVETPGDSWDDPAEEAAPTSSKKWFFGLF